MILVGVGRDDVVDGPSGGGTEDRRAMGLVVGSGIDHRQPAGSDEIGVGAFEGEGPRVLGDDADDAVGHGRGRAVGELHRGLEGELVGHAAI